MKIMSQNKKLCSNVNKKRVLQEYNDIIIDQITFKIENVF